MAKGKKSIFFCQNCGHEESKWLGQCPMCKEWNTFVEEKVTMSKTVETAKSRGELEVVTLSSVSTTEDERVKTGIGELDRVLGGGIVPGSLVLVGGDPGIGKSTLLLQVCQRLAESKKKVLYISGEESLKQIKLRANRMGDFSENLYLLCETNLDLIRIVIEREKPETVIIDSIQNGIVIDHISAGKAMELYRILGLDKLDCQVAIIKNARSSKMGRKDIIKIDGSLDLVNVDVLGYIDHRITINIIKDGKIVEKKDVKMPKKITNVIHCKNPRCITSIEQELPHIFYLADEEKEVYRCQYCDEKYSL